LGGFSLFFDQNQNMKTILALFFAALSGSLFAQNYYVSTTGNDSNPGTQAQPWRTIQHAANTVGAGSTVYIMAGTYTETVWVNVSGSAGNYITFTHFGSDVVTIDGGSTGTQTVLFTISGQNYLIVDGLHFTNATGNFSSGIYITNGASHIQIKNNQISNIHFSNNPNDPVTSSTNVNPLVVYNQNGSTACTDILIQNNQIFDCRTGFSEALTLNGNVDGFEVSGNTVHDITNIGIDLAGGYGVSNNSATDMARNGTVKDNVVYNCVSSYAVSAGIYVDGGQNIIVERNTSYANGRGFEVGAEQAGHTTTGITVRDNIAWQNQGAGIGIGGYDYPNTGKVTNSQVLNNSFYDNNKNNTWVGELLVEYSENCTIKNNIFYGKNTQRMMIVTRLNSTGLTINYNQYYHPDGATLMKVDYEGAVYTGFSAYQSGAGQDAQSAFGDPLFANTATPDLNIQSGSPAINAGDPAFVAGAGETDFAGNARVVGSGVDLGAYEFQMALPVEFADFSIYRAGEAVKLVWVTAAEINNRGFDIQRQTPAGSFQNIGFVAARAHPGTYVFSDSNPASGINYYRIKQTDYDGQVHFSPILAFYFDSPEPVFFPNPTDGHLFVQSASGTGTFVVRDISGAVVARAHKPAADLNLTPLSPGIYWVEWQIGVRHGVVRVIRQ